MTDNKTLNEFLKEVKTIEKADSIYTSKQQISRLLRPGSTYANLNPFDVLLLEFDSTPEQIKKQYKKLSILLHPDKNPDDKERAGKAFDVLARAYKTLDNEETRKEAMEVVEEARHLVRKGIEEKKRKMRREASSSSRKEPVSLDQIQLEEEKPERIREQIRTLTMKLFADYERKRRSTMDRLAQEKKRKHEEEQEEIRKKQEKEEWNKNYEQSRETRINSWKNFQTTKKVKRKEFRPPKPKAETR